MLMIGVFNGECYEMKNFVCVAIVVMGMCGISNGMMSPNSLENGIQFIQEKLRPVISSSSPFNQADFKSKLAPEVAAEAEELLDSSLSGDDSDLECLSERIHSGLLSNKPLFSYNFDIEQRDDLIYGLSMQILKNSIEGNLPDEASIVALKNIFTYCKDKTKLIGIMDLQMLVSSIFFQIQYTSSLCGK